MALSPENEARLKKVAKTGAILALAGMALKNNKVIGDKIRHSSFWEDSQGIVIDLIDNSKEKITRIAGTVIRNANGEVTDVNLDKDKIKGTIMRNEKGEVVSYKRKLVEPDYTDEEISELEEAFSESESTAAS